MKEKTAKRLRNYDKPLLNDLMRADSRANLDLANPKGALYNPTVELLISYPDEIEEILKHYKKAEAATMLQKTRGVVEWLRKNL